MRVVVFGVGDLFFALFDKLAVVQIAQIWRYTEIVAHVFGTGHLFAAEQGFVKLLAMTGTDDLNRMLRLAHHLGQGFGQRLYRGGRRLLHEQIAAVAMLEGIQHQVDCVSERHHEAGHVRISDRQRNTLANLFDEQRDHRTTRCHHVTVACTADYGLALIDVTGLGNHDFFHHGLGDPHGINGVDRLVGAQAYHPTHFVLDSRLE
ncbi:hypothetical protein D3C79_587550 [compost metagenome]